MNTTAWIKMVRKGSFLMVFCLALSLVFGILAQSSSPSSQTFLSSSNSHSNNIDTENLASGFGNEKVGNSIMLDSQSNAGDISARVYVKHYHRRDGTPVKSHYRRDPR
jgi:hypothetical protein